MSKNVLTIDFLPEIPHQKQEQYTDYFLTLFAETPPPSYQSLETPQSRKDALPPLELSTEPVKVKKKKKKRAKPDLDPPPAGMPPTPYPHPVPTLPILTLTQPTHLMHCNIYIYDQPNRLLHIEMFQSFTWD